jgi:hypothetical protein
MAGWLDGWMAGWLDGWMAGWLDGWMDAHGFGNLEEEAIMKAEAAVNANTGKEAKIKVEADLKIAPSRLSKR